MSQQRPEKTIPEVLHTASRDFGTMEAVVDTTGRPTFADVEAQVELRARALIASGVAAGDRVTIWAPNCLDWVLVSFAVYSVGAILVPINTRFKAEEADYILEKAGVRRVFTVAGFLDNDYVAMLDGTDLDEIVVMSGEVSGRAVSMDGLLERATSVDPAEVGKREDALGPESPCDIIFTSGTTGRPKGAILTHGSSIETYRQWSERVHLVRGDRALSIFPFFHTAGLKAGILAAFMQGATLVPHAVFEVESVAKLVADEKVTFVPGPPSIFQSILTHPDFASFDLSTLKKASTGAAMVPVELVERMRTDLGMTSVVTAFGLTETHGTATVSLSTDTAEIIANTVGYPLDGLDFRIVDDDGKDVAQGETGEVWIRGFCVTAGYYGDPVATAESITDGWLHTGDVGLLTETGHLRLVDRKKDIYIVGGFNVAPAEVERLLRTRDDIAQVAVVGAPDQRLGEVGAAFVVPRAGRTIDPAEVIAWSREHIANYKAPRYVLVVDALPATASGKVQKFVLRDRIRSLLSAEHTSTHTGLPAPA
jgi:HIP---CoA ligase